MSEYTLFGWLFKIKITSEQQIATLKSSSTLKPTFFNSFESTTASQPKILSTCPFKLLKISIATDPRISVVSGTPLNATPIINIFKSDNSQSLAKIISNYLDNNEYLFKQKKWLLENANSEISADNYLICFNSLIETEKAYGR